MLSMIRSELASIARRAEVGPFVTALRIRWESRTAALSRLSDDCTTATVHIVVSYGPPEDVKIKMGLIVHMFLATTRRGQT